MTTNPVEFGIETPGDHIVLLAAERRLLLDTGSPASIGGGVFELLGERYALSASGRELDLERLSDLVGARINGLLGTDIVGKVPFLVDWGSKVLRFLPNPASVEGASVELDTRLGVPIADIAVAGIASRCVVDTGAAISFLRRGGLPSTEPLCTNREFCLSEGGFVEFDTRVGRLPVHCGRDFHSVFGEVPAEMSAGLEALGVSSILGADLWKSGPVLFDLAAKRLVVL